MPYYDSPERGEPKITRCNSRCNEKISQPSNDGCSTHPTYRRVQVFRAGGWENPKVVTRYKNLEPKDIRSSR